MHKNFTRAGVVALIAPFALAAGTMPASAESEEKNGNAKNTAGTSSSAAISIDACEVTSDKEISYIAYLRDGVVIDKDERVGTTSYDLRDATVKGGFDTVKVKSGTSETTEAVADDCDGVTSSGGAQGSGDDEQADDSDKGKNSGDKAGDDEDNGQEQPDGQAGGSTGNTEDNPRGNSATTITLEGCFVDSGKVISYIAFFLDGELVQKDEDIDGQQFNLGNVGFDFDRIEVKAGTTISVIDVDQDCETADETDTTTGDAGDSGDAGVGGTTGGSDGDDNLDDNRGNDRQGVAENEGGNAGGGQVAGVEGTADRGEEAGQMTEEDEVAVLGVEETAAVPTEVAAGVGAEALPQTGVDDKLVMLGAIGLGLLALGGAAMVIRRRLGSEL